MPLDRQTVIGLGACVVMIFCVVCSVVLTKYLLVSGVEFQSSTVVLVSCIVRLAAAMALALYSHEGKVSEEEAREKEVRARSVRLERANRTWFESVWYWSPFMVPGALFAMYDNMFFYLMRSASPVTYTALGHVKIAMIVGLSHIFLGRRSSRIQLASLTTLTIASFVLQFDHENFTFQYPLQFYLEFFVAMFINASAAVTNEYLLTTRPDVSLHMQNVILYSCMALSNASYVIRYTDMSQAFVGFSGLTIVVVLTESFGGLATSFVIKYLGNIAKVFASALGLILIMGVSSVLFDLETSAIKTAICAIVIVTSTVTYSLHKQVYDAFTRRRTEMERRVNV